MVAKAIQKTTPSSIGKNLTIKRKFKKTMDGTTTKRWFVVRGSKCNIDHLEKEWPSVALQTGWKLEPLLCFEDAETSGPVSAQEPPNQNTQNTQLASDVSLGAINSNNTDTDAGNKPPVTPISPSPTPSSTEDSDTNNANNVPSSKSPFLEVN